MSKNALTSNQTGDKPDTTNPQAALTTPPASPALPRMAFSVKEAAQVLAVSKVTVRRLIARRMLTCVPGLRHKIIPKSSIERFLSGGKQ